MQAIIREKPKNWTLEAISLAYSRLHIATCEATKVLIKDVYFGRQVI
jgi:hypothetical protein